jgi:hypothetical protein
MDVSALDGLLIGRFYFIFIFLFETNAHPAQEIPPYRDPPTASIYTSTPSSSRSFSLSPLLDGGSYIPPY